MRAIDADKLKAKIRPVDVDDDRCAVLISDVKKIFHEQIDNAPTITYEDLVPHGRWKRRGRNLGECSECGEVVAVRHRYCPNCGAKMDGGKDNEAD